MQKARNNSYFIVGHDNITRTLIKDIECEFPTSMRRKSDIWNDSIVGLHQNTPKQFGRQRQDEIKNNIMNKASSGEEFTIKTLCQDLNYCYIINGQFSPHPTVKRFVKKNVDSGIFEINDGTTNLYLNTPLKIKI